MPLPAEPEDVKTAPSELPNDPFKPVVSSCLRNRLFQNYCPYKASLEAAFLRILTEYYSIIKHLFAQKLAKFKQLDATGRGHPAQLNFGDCVSYALAKVAGRPLAFKGEDFNLTDLEVVKLG